MIVPFWRIQEKLLEIGNKIHPENSINGKISGKKSRSYRNYQVIILFFYLIYSEEDNTLSTKAHQTELRTKMVFVNLMMKKVRYLCTIGNKLPLHCYFITTRCNLLFINSENTKLLKKKLSSLMPGTLNHSIKWEYFCNNSYIKLFTNELHGHLDNSYNHPHTKNTVMNIWYGNSFPFAHAAGAGS